MQTADLDQWMPLADAARELGVSTDTLRRRLRKGQLVGEQRPTPQGFVWWGLSKRCRTGTQRAAYACRPGGAACVAGCRGAERGSDRVFASDRRLQRENRDLAGLVGSLQQRLVFADERIRMLEAPKEPTPSEIASSGPTAAFSVEVTTEPARPKRLAWWQFWAA